jgi:glycine/D-amino acid oxidase-like deaminating enzyme
MRTQSIGAISRRTMLIGGAGFAASLASTSSPPAAADTLDVAAWRPLDPSRILQVPDFGRTLPDSEGLVTGVRPIRHGGIAMHSERNEAARKIIIHHYGHGGAGITLSWGSAKRVRGEIEKAVAQARSWGASPSIVILGAGIAGLTVARELVANWRRDWPPLGFRIYAQRFLDTASYIAGGQFEPSGIHRIYALQGAAGLKTLSDLLRDASETLCAMSATERERYGISRRRNFALDQPIAGFNAAHMPLPPVVFGPSRRFDIRFESGPARPGYEYETWLMNPTILMPALRQDLTRAGVVFQVGERRFLEPADVLRLPETIIVNCTGIGARRLFNDTRLEGHRGHLVKLRNPDGLRYLLSFGCNSPTDRLPSYIFCRERDIVIGGSWERDERYLNPKYSWPRFEPDRTAEGYYGLRCDRSNWERILTRARYVLAGMPGCPVGGPR